ncbi:MAG: GTPase HflX [Pseudomonadota bacterium]
MDRRPVAEKALVVQITRANAAALRDPDARLAEAVGLARALDFDVVEQASIALRAITPATLFGKGRVEEIGREVEDLAIDVVVVDDQLTPVQQRNLEKAWDAKVVDRTGLILEIFARRARTREGKLQVELARLAYERSRLVRTWTHLERQRGGFGVMGGPGETQIETDRRLIADKIAKLKRELEEVRRTRSLHREARKRTPYPTVALVGYTNAGKSTLFNRLTDGGVLAKDMLFATLDPTLRELRLPDGRPAILSDTVGFISDLPHELVEAFRATLEEVKTADLILHVRDMASPVSDAEAADVEEVLERLDLGPDSHRRLIEVWNKADLAPEDERGLLAARAKRGGEGGRPLAVVVSALTGEGCAELLRAVADAIDEAPEMQAELSAENGEALAWLYRHGRVVAREDEDDGQVRVRVRLDGQALGRFGRLFPAAQLTPAQV